MMRISQISIVFASKALRLGEKIWSYEVSDETSSPAIIGGMIVVGSEDGTVTAFGAADG